VVRRFQVLTDCTTKVAKGEVVVVCGPSGSGKSTLIKTVNALEPFQKGDILVDGTSVGDPKTNLPKLRARGHGVPALRAVPAPVDHREPDHRADQGAGPQKDEAMAKGLKCSSAWA
jgi:glutamate/aspartate transport system ATP-binding protein